MDSLTAMMQPVAAQMLLAGALVFLMVAGPFLGAGLMVLRRRRIEARRRSPIGIDLLRGPAQTLREQIEEVRLDVLLDVVLLSILPVFLAATVMAQWLMSGRPPSAVVLTALVIAGFVSMGWVLRNLWRRSARLDRLRAGHDAEVAVGQELDQLMRQGAFVFHDVPGNDFNVDHVVVSESGVFAVETKGYTKPNRGRGKADASVAFDGTVLRFPTWSTSEPIEQARRQAAWLGRWLGEAVAQPVQALPVLALPGWYVERQGRGDVRVFNGRELAGLLRSRGGQALSIAEVERIAHQLEQRCRTVEPTLRRSRSKV